ncbi:hypothetical protein LA080_014960 [Diaporthe eres]|nr:hypothetical protein LA080_014960 [Diaporthe eres]
MQDSGLQAMGTAPLLQVIGPPPRQDGNTKAQHVPGSMGLSGRGLARRSRSPFISQQRGDPSTCNICNKKGRNWADSAPSDQACATSSCAPMSPTKSPSSAALDPTRRNRG